MTVIFAGLASAAALSPIVQSPNDIPPEVIDIVKVVFGSITAIALGIPIIRAMTKRWERSPMLPPATSPDVTARLERIEQAVEAVAIEVERIAEAQRFTAKLMAEQQKRALASPESMP
jgi:hypothetical protein